MISIYNTHHTAPPNVSYQKKFQLASSQQCVTYCCSNYTQHTSKLQFVSHEAVIIFHYAQRLLSELSWKTQQIRTMFQEKKHLKKRGCLACTVPPKWRQLLHC